MSGSSLVDALRLQEQAWETGPLVRRLHRAWYCEIVARLAAVPGASVELGSGSGRLATWPVTGSRSPTSRRPRGQTVPSTHWRCRTRTARSRTGTGGRMVAVEPYCSPLSTPLYRRFHEERTELEVDPFIPDPAIAEAPFESNQALPTLAFYRRRDELARRWPALRLFEERRLAFVLYPLSRGFPKPPLVPAVLVSPLELLERLLRPLAPLLAIRCLVVLEKRV